MRDRSGLAESEKPAGTIGRIESGTVEQLRGGSIRESPGRRCHRIHIAIARETERWSYVRYVTGLGIGPPLRAVGRDEPHFEDFKARPLAAVEARPGAGGKRKSATPVIQQQSGGSSNVRVM